MIFKEIIVIIVHKLSRRVVHFIAAASKALWLEVISLMGVCTSGSLALTASRVECLVTNSANSYGLGIHSYMKASKLSNYCRNVSKTCHCQHLHQQENRQHSYINMQTNCALPVCQQSLVVVRWQCCTEQMYKDLELFNSSTNSQIELITYYLLR